LFDLHGEAAWTSVVELQLLRTALSRRIRLVRIMSGLD